jgi:hypothetical protein
LSKIYLILVAVPDRSYIPFHAWFARSEVTCGNGEDDVSLVSDPTNGHRILDNVDTTILSVIKVFNNIWAVSCSMYKEDDDDGEQTAHTEAISKAPGRATL